MFRCELESDLSQIFGIFVALDLGQARNLGEAYYHHSTPIDVSVSDGNSMLFTGKIMVEMTFSNDFDYAGFMTAKTHDYSRKAHNGRLVDQDKFEIPVSMTQGVITIAKELAYSYIVEHDKVHETIKSINWG